MQDYTGLCRHLVEEIFFSEKKIGCIVLISEHANHFVSRKQYLHRLRIRSTRLYLVRLLAQISKENKNVSSQSKIGTNDCFEASDSIAI